MGTDREEAGTRPAQGFSRRALRESVFKLLFMAEFNDEAQMEEQFRIYFDGVGSDLLEQMKTDAANEEDAAYIHEKYLRVREKLDEIDPLLNETSEGWKTSRMSRVDLSVLRLAVYEIRYDEDVPVKVAINEAVEIAKKFGGEDSGSFVNGILGKIAGKTPAQKE